MKIKMAQMKNKEAIKTFHTKPPPIIQYNIFNASENVFKEYQRKFLDKKKNYELQIIRDNKEFEI